MPTPPTVPGYRAEELLGRGGHGEVWRGVDLASGRPVALKLLVGAGSGSDRLRAEVAAAGALAGPHVVPVLDVRTVGDDAVVVTELAGGGSLADAIATRGRLSAAEVVTVLAPIGAVLADAHARLIVHGDVGPANLLFTTTGRPMLADWGLTRVMAELGGSGRGTPGYVDPAVLAGDREPDSAADIAGLAAAGYAALTGRPPWQPDGSWSRVAVQRAAPLCPPSLAAALEAGLSVRPEDRPAAGDFVAAVMESCDPQPVVLPRRAARGAAPPVTLSRPKVASGVRPIPGTAQGARAATRRRGPDRADAGQAQGHGPGRRAIVGVTATVVGLAMVGVVAGVIWSRQGRPAATLTQPALPPAAQRSAGSASVASSASAGSAVPQGRHRPAASRSADLGTAGASVAAISWQRLLQALARERAAALRRRDPALLDRVYLAGSGAGTADRATVMQLRRRGVIPRGLRIRVGPVRPLDGEAAGSAAPGNGASAVVEMVSTVSSYRLVDAATGSTVDVAPASPGHAIRVTLRHTGGGWRIAALGPG